MSASPDPTDWTRNAKPGVTKWPFLAGDILLLGVAWWIASRSPDPFATVPLLLLVGCVGMGAWISIIPFLAEYRGSLTLAEADSLQSVAEKINQLEQVGAQVAQATGQWQDVQGHADRTRAAIAEISERMTAEAKAFGEFMQKANEAEKQHLRLEVDKMRRAEGDWLQVLVLVLDHVYALYRGAVHSRKAPVIEQIGRFQHACREAVRRLGLVPFEIKPGDPYDPNLHQLENPDQAPPEGGGAVVTATLATGFTYQGKALRKPLVSLQPPELTATSAVESPSQTGDLFGGEKPVAEAPGKPLPSP